jgi:hypothetical protein
MRIVKKPDGWWVVEIHPESGDCGPYTKDEAEEHRRALQRTLDHLNDRKFWTSERLKDSETHR